MSNSRNMLRTVPGTYGHSGVLGVFPLSDPRSGVRRLNKEAAGKAVSVLLDAQVTNCDIALGREKFTPICALSLGNLAAELDSCRGTYGSQRTYVPVPLPQGPGQRKGPEQNLRGLFLSTCDTLPGKTRKQLSQSVYEMSFCGVVRPTTGICSRILLLSHVVPMW